MCVVRLSESHATRPLIFERDRPEAQYLRVKKTDPSP